jgi:hypothetical protein
MIGGLMGMSFEREDAWQACLEKRQEVSRPSHKWMLRFPLLTRQCVVFSCQFRVDSPHTQLLKKRSSSDFESNQMARNATALKQAHYDVLKLENR